MWRASGSLDIVELAAGLQEGKPISDSRFGDYVARLRDASQGDSPTIEHFNFYGRLERLNNLSSGQN